MPPNQPTNLSKELGGTYISQRDIVQRNTFVLDTCYSELPIILSSFLSAEEHQFPPRLPLAPQSQCISKVGYDWLKPISSVQLPGYGDWDKFYHIRCRTCFLRSSWGEAPSSEILKVHVRAGAAATVLLL